MEKTPETTIIRTSGDVVTIPRKEYDSLITSRAALTFILNSGADSGNADHAVIESIRKSVRKPETKSREQVDFTKDTTEDKPDA